MTFMKCLGDWLEDSGWTDLLSHSSVITSGKANAMLSPSSNMVLCRYIHQVTACALHIKRKEAYRKSTEMCTDIPSPSESEWEIISEKHPMFKFWNLTLHLELILFEFVKSI